MIEKKINKELSAAEIENLLKENAYLRRAAQESAAKIFSLEAQSIVTRHELEQKRRGFSLMAELTTSLRDGNDYDSIFTAVSRRINATLNMQRTVVLRPEAKGVFKASILHGCTAEEKARISALCIKPDPELLEPGRAVLVTGEDPEDRLVSFRTALGLPYFISVPVVLYNEVAAILVTGRLAEQPQYSPRLGSSDVETVQTVGAYLVAMLASQRLVEAEKRTQIMLDATPLCCTFWDEEYNNIDCNEAAAHLFGLTSKEEFLELFWELSPKFQPDGSCSRTSLQEKIQEAYATGRVSFEWQHQKLDGSLLPTEVTLVRVEYQGHYIVVGYTRDLRELKGMLAEMQNAYEQLRESRDLAEKNAKAKTDFLANMSHEIRTPMNAVVGMTYLLRGTELTEQQKKYVEKAEHSAHLLLRIINDILDFTKIEAGRMDMENIEFSLRQTIANVDDIIADQAAAKKLKWGIEIDPDAPDCLIGDPLRLSQVLINLCTNAVKFTFSGSVALRVFPGTPLEESSDGKVDLRFEVSDTGIGMNKEQLASLFTPFTQADTSTTRKFGGTGLGLAISQSLATLMGGRIICESTFGVGSKFILTTSLGVVGGNICKAFDVFSPPPRLECSDSIAGVKVLLAEDNEINQMIAIEMLKEHSVNVQVVGTGLEAIEALEKDTYDLVLMDIQMPVMDGLTATEKIRGNPKYAKLPIIAMTAHAMSGDRDISLSAGMNDHLTKPINPQKLYEAIQRWGCFMKQA